MLTRREWRGVYAIILACLLAPPARLGTRGDRRNHHSQTPTVVRHFYVRREGLEAFYTGHNQCEPPTHHRRIPC